LPKVPEIRRRRCRPQRTEPADSVERQRQGETKPGDEDDQLHEIHADGRQEATRHEVRRHDSAADQRASNLRHAGDHVEHERKRD
jgi:hypothetical protein